LAGSPRYFRLKPGLQPAHFGTREYRLAIMRASVKMAGMYRGTAVKFDGNGAASAADLAS
jgi:hypothetical protein